MLESNVSVDEYAEEEYVAPRKCHDSAAPLSIHPPTPDRMYPFRFAEVEPTKAAAGPTKAQINA
jgi:hypothetical protein